MRRISALKIPAKQLSNNLRYEYGVNTPYSCAIAHYFFCLTVQHSENLLTPQSSAQSAEHPSRI